MLDNNQDAHGSESPRDDEPRRSGPAKKKSRKRKSSRALRDVQKLEEGVSRALHRVARSTEAGIRTWRKASKKSARKKRDGAIRDAVENYARAVSKQVGGASRAPLDIVQSLPKPRIRKALANTFPIFFR